MLISSTMSGCTFVCDVFQLTQMGSHQRLKYLRMFPRRSTWKHAHVKHLCQGDLFYLTCCECCVVEW